MLRLLFLREIEQRKLLRSRVPLYSSDSKTATPAAAATARHVRFRLTAAAAAPIATPRLCRRAAGLA